MQNDDVVHQDDEPREPVVHTIKRSELEGITTGKCVPGDSVYAYDTNETFVCVGAIGDKLQWQKLAPLRKITVARAMTRLKVINAQLKDLVSNQGYYGNWSNKTLCHLSDETDLDANHKASAAKIKHEFALFQELCKEIAALTLGIQRANMKTKIKIAGSTITIAEAIVIKDNTLKKYKEILGAYSNSLCNAEHMVKDYNDRLAEMPAIDGVANMADMVYFTKREDIEALKAFVTTFSSEINDVLAEAYATTVMEY